MCVELTSLVVMKAEINIKNIKIIMFYPVLVREKQRKNTSNLYII